MYIHYESLRYNPGQRYLFFRRPVWGNRCQINILSNAFCPLDLVSACPVESHKAETIVPNDFFRTNKRFTSGLLLSGIT
jgi:hypothetical protein